MPSLKKYLGALLSLLIITCLFIEIGCSKKKDTDVIKIGAILPLTGVGASVGTHYKETLQLIEDRYAPLFKQSGFKIKFIIEDSRSSPKDAINAYQKIIFEHPDVQVIFSIMSSVASAITPIAKKDNKTIISISSTTEPLKVYDGFYVNYLSSKQQSEIYNHFFKSQKIDDLTVFYINDEYGRSISHSLKQIFPGKVKLVEYDINTTIKDLVAKEKRFLGKGIIVIGYGAKIAEIVKNIRNQGIDKIILCSPEMLVPETLGFIKGYENNVFSIDFNNLPKDIEQIFRERFHRMPSTPDKLIFSAATLVLETYLLAMEMKKDISSNTIMHELWQDKKTKATLLNKVPLITDINNNMFYYESKIVHLQQN